MGAGAIAFLIVALVVAPHLLPQERIAASSGIALWMASLALRAVLSLSLVLVAVLYLPATELFSLLTHWCFHAVLPFLTTHLGFDGHRLGDTAVIVPGLVIAASSLSVGFGLWRGARAVRRWLNRSSLGPGPASSVIVAGSEILVAAAGLRAPRVVVSAGALLRLDDAELAAGLEHEWGHVRRNHRSISVIAEICGALARLLPGTKRALATLRLHLERDADDYAVRQTGDQLALASAICKAAQSKAHPQSAAAFASLAGSGVSERLRRLAHDSASSDSHLGTLLARFLATSMLFATLGLLAATPTLGATGLEPVDRSAMNRAMDCD